MKIDPKTARAWLAQQPEQGFISSNIPQTQTEAQIKKQHRKIPTVLDLAIVKRNYR